MRWTISRTPSPTAGVPAADGARRQVWRDSRGAAWAVATSSGRERRLTLTGVGDFVLDPRRGEVTGRPAPGVSRDRFERAFEAEALPMLHQANGALALHASAVAAGGDGAIAFVGPGGCGKSTLAWAWSRRRGAQLADDVVVLYRRRSGHVVQLLPFRPHLRPAARARLGPVDRPPRCRTSAAGLFLRALYFIDDRTRGGASAVRPLSLRAAFPQLLRESICSPLDDERAKAAFFEASLDLLAAVSCRRLVYRHDFATLGATLDAVEEDVGEM